MSKKEEFKKFIYKHPEYIDYVRNNNISWQSLYELYDIYGEKEEIWNKYTQTNTTNQINIKNILNSLKNINIDSLEENISSIQKAVMLIEELKKPSEKKETISKEVKNIDKIFGEE